MTPLRRLLRGAGAWRRAFGGVVSQKSLRAFIALPLIVNGALLLLLLYFMVTSAAPWLSSLIFEKLGTGWWAGALTFLTYLTTLVLWALLVLPVYALSNILLAPIHSLAAEQVLKSLGLKLPTPVGWVAWTKFLVRSFAIGLARSAVLLVLAVLLFLGGFLPVVGVVFVYLSFVILAFDCTDYSLEILDKGFRERFSYLRRYLWEYLGFGLVFFLVGFIPLAMIILLPLGTVAGAYLVADLEESLLAGAESDGT